MNTQTTPMAVLATALREAKLAEESAKNARIAIEEQILTYFPTDKEEGSITDADNGITCTFKLTRKVDTAALQAAWGSLHQNVQRAFKWSADVDTKQLRALADLDAENAYAAQTFITTTPAKTAVTLKAPK